MSKRGKKKPMIEELILPTREQMRNGAYEPAFVLHAETGRKSRAFVNRESSILEKWMRDGGIGFEQGACNVIRDCQYFWARMGSPRLAANYGERMASSTGEGHTAHEASASIAQMSKGIPKPYWDIFENVVRHGEPAGVAGSRLASNTAQQIASAKTVVGFVASFVAGRLGY